MITSRHVITWAAPAGEAASTDYALAVDGQLVHVYTAPVRCEILQNDGLWTHEADYHHETASFAIFDITGPVEVVITPSRPFQTAVVLPERAPITPEIADGTVRFTLAQPRHVTVLLDDDDRVALHLFVSDPEQDVPRPDDPSVIYFGPGVHEVDTLTVRDGQTVYLAGGAVVRAVLRQDEAGVYNDKWKVTFYNGVAFDLTNVASVRVCGRGILDGGAILHPGHSLMRVYGSQDIRMEGITLRNSPNWNVTIINSEDVSVDGLRLVSGRLNSDGINSVNARRVRMKNCFVRNHDDSFAVKTLLPEGPAEDILIEQCQVWNDWGFALGVTYETRAPIRNITYRQCDILSARHWVCGVHISDSATIDGVTFQDIGITDLSRSGHLRGSHSALSSGPVLLKVSITQDVWGKDEERGRIRNVALDGATLHGEALPVMLHGYDAEHDIRGVTIRHVRRDGQPVELPIEHNDFVSDLIIEP